MDKCEWKDGRFQSCENFGPDLGANQAVKCAACGCTMWPKPSKDLVIKKSGGTWVARAKGLDLFCDEPDSIGNTAEKIIENMDLIDSDGEICGWWKPMSEIEITDEIAKLRPVVKDIYGIAILIAIFKDSPYPFKVCSLKGSTDGWRECRLATIDDVED